MSLSMLLLKMIHCKQKNGPSTSTTGESAGKGNSLGESSREKTTIKKEHNEDNVCRVCLKEGGIPIFGNDILEDISESFNTFANIEARIDDPYPKYLCQPCNALLQGAILFRKTAQQSDEILKELEAAGNDDVIDNPEDDNSLEYVESKVRKKRSHRCKKCKISFSTFEEYNNHILSEEHENMKVACPICNNSYSAAYLRRHLILHKGNDPYMCDICGKSFIWHGQFNRHRLTHFYELPFKCTLCPYKGRFPEALKMHMRSHTGEKPYQCTQCPARFISKSNLNKHTRTHNPEYEFKCDACHRGFHTKRELELHFKVDHTGIKDHFCSICGKEFGYRKQMMKHEIKVHNRAKLRSGRMPIYLKVESMKQQGQDISIES